jgi:DNA-binding winged helix-turn-helix (wHTH) protein/tetratricopeptide (TPR) repeat protein
MSEPAKSRYEFGPFLLDTGEQTLLRGGEPVPLTPKAFETLALLVANSGHVIGKQEFIEKVWPGTFVEPNNLNVNISTLRKALGTTPDGQEYIETVPRRGYRFTACVRELPPDEVRPPARNGAHARHEAINSLAVLPLINASADPTVEYLSDGITESIINSLSQLPQLRVMARSTVFRYKGRDVHPQEAGHEMGVRAVLTGRVFQFSDRLIIRAELTDVADGWQLWGEQYNSEPADIFVVQEEISQEISAKLRLRLSGEERLRLAKRHTESADAYQAYLKGRFYWNKRTVENLKKSVELFEEAIRLDPNYALAYAGLADAYLLLGSVEYGALDPVEATEKARQSATAAFGLDASLAEAHASLAYVRIFDWDWAEAEREYQRAIELNPSYATAYHWYGLYLTAMGRPEEGFANLRRARELDPLSLPINVGVGFYYYLMRRYAEAVAEYRKTLEMEPNFYMTYFGLGMALTQDRMYDGAIAAYRKAIELSGGSPLMRAGLGHAYAAAGRGEEARAILGELGPGGGGPDQKSISPYFMAAIHAGLSEHDEAFRKLQEACRTRSEGLFWLKVDPVLDSLRADPRFADILRFVGLA